MAKPLRRRKATVALGLSGDRGSLVADLKADKLEAEANARQAAADAKRAAAETWAKEANRLKTLSQQYQDGEMTLADFKKEVDSSKSKFQDNTDDIEQMFRQSVRNRDTVQYNNYIQGGSQYQDFKAYYDQRVKDGGDLSNLNNLLAQARLNEDKNQYSQYQNGMISFEQLQQYQQTRTKDGGDLTKLNGYVALAKQNENKVNDQLQQAQYQAGAISGAEYKDYLNKRISEATDPKEATALRTTMQQVSVNETMKSADDVRAAYEAGEIDGGTAVQRLMGIRSSTNDSSTQNKLLSLVGQIQAADKAKSGGSSSSSAAINRIVDQMSKIETDAKGDYDKAMAIIREKAGNATDADYAKLSDLAYLATKQYANSTALARDNTPDPAWADVFNRKVQTAGDSFSSTLFELATTVAGNLTKSANAQTGANINKYGDAAKFLIETASANPHMSGEDRQRLIDAGRQTLAQGQAQWMQSSEGIQWRDFVNNTTNQLSQNGGVGLMGLAQLAGVDPSKVGDGKQLVQSLLLNNPDTVRRALELIGQQGYKTQGIKDNGQGALLKGITPEDFSKQIADLTVGLRALGAANDSLYQKTGQNGLSALDYAEESIYNPDHHNANVNLPDPNEMRYGQAAATRKAQDKVNETNLRLQRDEGYNSSTGSNFTEANTRNVFPVAVPNANQREDRFGGNPMEPSVDPLADIQLRQRLNPYTQDATPPSPFNVDVQGREDRNQPAVDNGPMPRSLDLAPVTVNPFQGNDSLDQNADPYAYLQNLLNQRSTDLNLSTPSSDISIPSETPSVPDSFSDGGAVPGDPGFRGGRLRNYDA